MGGHQKPCLYGLACLPKQLPETQALVFVPVRITFAYKSEKKGVFYRYLDDIATGARNCLS